MFWNYRVIKKIHDDGTEIFAIHEVYYNEDEKPDLVTEDPCEPQGETLEELKDDCEWYQKALEHPVLNYDDFGGSDLTLADLFDAKSADNDIDLALLSEAALAQDWDRPEEDEAWSHLAQLPSL